MAIVSQAKNKWRADWVDVDGVRHRLRFKSREEAEKCLGTVQGTGLTNLLPEKRLSNSSSEKPVCQSVPNSKHQRPNSKGNTRAMTHGLATLRKVANILGSRMIDKRTATGKALAKWRHDLIQDLGGDVSTQQSTIVDLAVKSKLLLDSIDVWLLTQETLVNRRKKSLIPVVKERQSLADGLAKYLSMLGLERRSKQVTLQDYIASKYETKDSE